MERSELLMLLMPSLAISPIQCRTVRGASSHHFGRIESPLIISVKITEAKECQLLAQD